MDTIQQLETLAEKLGELCEEIVVVGGCSPVLILDAKIAPDLRATNDIDILVQTENYVRYNRFIEKMKERGFAEKIGERIGRLVSGDLVVDVVPTEVNVLGFTNRWYKEAFVNAVYRRLPSGRHMRTVTPVYFVATKLEAFRDPGRGDALASPDLEDIVTILVEYPSFEKDLRRSGTDIQRYMSEQFKKLMSRDDYPHTLSGHLRGDEASQAFLPELLQLVERIATLDL